MSGSPASIVISARPRISRNSSAHWAMPGSEPPRAADEAEAAHMRAAIALAQRGLGDVWPNPSVGCVIGRDGRVIARARTAPGGRPHAETQALVAAGEAARGACAYVSLEPCCHYGRTPPCTEALIAAGVGRVVIGAPDPDPRVSGGGIAALRAAGIAGFAIRMRAGRPLVTLKLASTIDGRIATAGGESKWITGAAARRAAHALRGAHDAVMVGSGTVLADDPDLTCRLPGFRARPLVRVVADTRLRTPPSARLFADRNAPVWVLSEAPEPSRRAALEMAGARIIDAGATESSPPSWGRGPGGGMPGGTLPTPPPDPLPQGGRELQPGAAAIRRALLALGTEGLTSVLVEGGSALAASLLRADLVDRIAWFHAPAIRGGDGVPAVGPLGLAVLAAMPRFRRRAARPLGEDMLTDFERAA